ncbi:MAG: arsenosugar biosynthesis radical SAM (seleno)protein ArsS [Gemmatimonadales bacterium]
MGRVLPTLQKQHAPLASGAEQQATLATVPLARSFKEALAQSSLYPLRATGVDILQINVGKKCNQTCRHCHVDAGPDRTEMMPREVMEKCLEVLATTDIPTVDITGGAPELHPDFRELVARSRAIGKHVMDRCNLTILLLPNYSKLPEFFAEHQVEVICSLPHYRAKQTDSQRGDGVFDESIEALGRLNAVGYGKPGSGLVINLVMNPVGAFLPGNQTSLEREWKRELEHRHGIVFNNLYTITNMPISRFLEWLEESDNLEGYMSRLVNAFNPGAARGVMCRNTLSVGWDGQLYDCDFNQMLELGVAGDVPRSILDFDIAQFRHRKIVVGPHCFGCTAGAGSSCGGATVN